MHLKQERTKPALQAVKCTCKARDILLTHMTCACTCCCFAVTQLGCWQIGMERNWKGEPASDRRRHHASWIWCYNRTLFSCDCRKRKRVRSQPKRRLRSMLKSLALYWFFSRKRMRTAFHCIKKMIKARISYTNVERLALTQHTRASVLSTGVSLLIHHIYKWSLLIALLLE